MLKSNPCMPSVIPSYISSLYIASCVLAECIDDICDRHYLRNRKRVACVYCVIIRVFYTLLEHYKRTWRVFLYFFYNISRRYYIINNFTQWHHAHAFSLLLSLEFLFFKRAKEQNCENNIQTFDAIKPEKLSKIKKTVIHRLIC
jgi:hypothetical protein